MNTQGTTLSRNAIRLFCTVRNLAADDESNIVNRKDGEIAGRSGFPLKALNAAQQELKAANMLKIRQGNVRSTYQLLPAEPLDLPTPI